MKRLVILVILLSIPFSVLCVNAAECDFYCTYTPKTEKSSVFFIDVFCDRGASAALIELGYDREMAEYRSVEAASSDAEVSCNPKDDRLLIACAGRASDDGRLCRVTFVALDTGDCVFELHMKQAVDENLDYINSLADHRLKVTFGEDDIVETAAVSAPSSSVSSIGSTGGASSSKTASKTSTSSKSEKSSAEKVEASEKSGESTARDADMTADAVKDSELLYNVSDTDPTRYIMLGAGAVALAVAVAAVGYMLGKKTLIKKKTDKAVEEALPDDTDDEQQDT